MSVHLESISVSLRRIADAQVKYVELSEEMLKHVTRPRQLFADYDAGRAVAEKERAALLALLYEALEHIPDCPFRERIKDTLEGK